MEGLPTLIDALELYRLELYRLHVRSGKASLASLMQVGGRGTDWRGTDGKGTDGRWQRPGLSMPMSAVSN